MSDIHIFGGVNFSRLVAFHLSNPGLPATPTQMTVGVALAQISEEEAAAIAKGEIIEVVETHALDDAVPAQGENSTEEYLCARWKQIAEEKTAHAEKAAVSEHLGMVVEKVSAVVIVGKLKGALEG
jgi:hypothetical protein